jgi:hypothetical protein
MVDFCPNIKIIEKLNSNSNYQVDLFIKKITEFNNDTNFFHFLKLSNDLLDSLIDICIKNKIAYFINNNVSFSNIKINFKLELENFLLMYVNEIYPFAETKLLNLNLNNLDNANSNNCWNNIIDVLSNKHVIKTKNKVSFNPNATEYLYKFKEHSNLITKKKLKPIKIKFDLDKENISQLTSEHKLAIFFKIIFTNQLYISALTQKLYTMCSIISDNCIEYNIYKPFTI